MLKGSSSLLLSQLRLRPPCSYLDIRDVAAWIFWTISFWQTLFLQVSLGRILHIVLKALAKLLSLIVEVHSQGGCAIIILSMPSTNFPPVVGAQMPYSEMWKVALYVS